MYAASNSSNICINSVCPFHTPPKQVDKMLAFFIIIFITQKVQMSAVPSVSYFNEKMFAFCLLMSVMLSEVGICDDADSICTFKQNHQGRIPYVAMTF